MQASTSEDDPFSPMVATPHYLALRCSILCVAAAQQLVDLIHSIAMLMGFLRSSSLGGIMYSASLLVLMHISVRLT